MSATQDFDTGPLNWVRNDIETALKNAADRVRVHQTDSALENALRLARDEVHMATGALRMVGLEGATKVATALEDVLTGMDSKSIAADALNTKNLLDALEALHKWIGRMADGRGEGDLALFPAYRKLRTLSGIDQVSESDLFFPNLKIQRDVSASNISQDDLSQRVKAARGDFQRGLLAFLRGIKSEAGLATMQRALSIVESSVATSSARAFWWVCVGFIDALQNKGIEPDFNVKQLLARIDLQMRRLMDGSPQVAERLMRDALFFVATSKAHGNESQAVRAAFELDKYLPKQQYLDADQLARIRPVLKSLKETLAEARNLWNACSEGNQSAVPDFEATVSRLFTQAGALNIASLGGLITELHDTALTINRMHEHLREAARLEIATTLLFLQNTIDTEDVLDATFTPRAQSQIRRLHAACAGQAEASATDLLDENAQKAAEHALFTQLGREISSNLQQIEEHLDTFFRDPDARDGLSSLSGLSAQAQGALAILDQSEAALLLQKTIDSMRPYSMTGVPSDEEKSRVAEALSSLGLFVEAHCSGKKNAAHILTHAQVLFGLASESIQEEETQTVEAALPTRLSSVASTYLEWQNNTNEEARKKCLAALTELGHDADLIADAKLKAATAAALQTLREQTYPDAPLAAQIADLTGTHIPVSEPVEINVPDIVHADIPDVFTPPPSLEELEPDTADLEIAAIAIESVPDVASFETTAESWVADLAAPELAATSAGPIAENPAVSNESAEATEPATLDSPQDAQAIDDELLGIFLEEAEEVLGNLSAAAEACESSSDDHENLTVIRRAFHTLKGSGRMVGLTEFGEASWGMEQLLNGWLAAEKPATANLLATVRKAHSLFSDWVELLQTDAAAKLDYSPLLAEAAALVQTDEETVTPSLAPSAPTVPVAPEEICIGEVCLSPGLYGVFKVESAQWAQLLEEESTRLGLALPAQVSEGARRGVHTLAGIAGTTGFQPLSALSSAVENYFRRLENTPLPISALTTVQAALGAICSMIRDIHNSLPPQHAGELIAQLEDLPVSADTPAVADEQIEVQDLIHVEEPPASLLPIEEAHGIETVVSSPVELPSIEEVGLTEDDISLQEMLEQARKTATPVFEQRSVQDELDEVLLPIFLEEAETLLPEAAKALRGWKETPATSDAPATLRRVLHTIKGSARMAGAMRLGELTHIMESRVIAVLEGQAQAEPAVFEALEDEYDRMADTVDRLKSGSPETETIRVETVASDTDIIIAETIPEPGKPALAEGISQAAAVSVAEATQPRDGASLRVRADWLDRMVNQAGEVSIARSRIESEMFALKRQVTELSEALRRLKDHLREVEIQAESQMQATFQSQAGVEHFDPLEFDRFTRFQEVTRFMAESVHDVSTVHQNLAIQLGEADAALLQQSRINRELQQNLLRVRMVPLYSVSERLYRVVRQAARDANKRAQLDITGGDLEMDRGVLEKVVAPLEHLLRNAIAHGLETSAQRTAAGKPEFGEVRLSARHEGNEMVLTIQDDGAGLNLERIREKALKQGLLSSGVEPNENQLAQMIFVPGFTTAKEVTQLAGRGVGMDVVKNEITSLGGRIEIATEAGKGVRFTIYLPLTLAVTQAVMITAHKHEYALPATLVEQVQELKPDQLEAALQARAIEWRGNRYPLFYLPHLLGQLDATHEIQRFNAIVLMKSGTSHAALLVDSVEGAREIVVKNIGPQLARVTGIAGATVRGDGKVVLILNPVPLALRAQNSPSYGEASVTAPAAVEPIANQSPLVLVVDDSLTVRKITTRLMAREGYRVDTAKDGVDALEKMQDILPDVVLLDVEMPRMDGFELARVMRNDAKLKHIPIIMITSRTADKHRNHAIEIGVNVYLGKPFQEAVLLGHIADLLGERAMV